MAQTPRIEFLSLFVPDLDAAVNRYRAVLGIEPALEPGLALSSHPFATKGPVVFQLGEVALALYQCDMRTTHPGDLGIGLRVEDNETVHRFGETGGQVFWASPQPQGPQLAIGVTPERHFFEMVAAEPTRS